MQVSHAQAVSAKELFLGTVPVLVAAFAYPLGNRKMMQITNGSLTAFQRTLGMTLCSLPFWVLLSLLGVTANDLPTQAQISQTLIIGISSGVIATSLFFMATDRVRKDEKSLAAVEATQPGEVLFALIGEIFILKMDLPDAYSIAGMFLVVIGMLLHSFKK